MEATTVAVGVLAAAWGAAIVAGCAGAGSSGPVPTNRDFVDGVRQTPVDPDEVWRALNAKAHRFRGCYQRVRLVYSLEEPSSYAVKLVVPNDGTPPQAEVLERSVPGQDQLETCIVEVAETLSFPRHVGEPLVVKVPIEAPKR